ncbi:hypothetical protein RHMOL_Rhmol08G0109400 [Rhododendron molle]|uniref:Uncharacterized protein n=1 Tax=Rhododendron molle TaxID=49168 RepID=A0ACC0MMR8_RHOML|nr:hypothetical protein RHMOL_Rhmol08G0109400 [Rhododendron molle]
MCRMTREQLASLLFASMTAAVPPQIRSLLKVQSFSIVKTNYTILLLYPFANSDAVISAGLLCCTFGPLAGVLLLASWARHDSGVHLRVASVLVAVGIHWRLDCQRFIMPHAIS